MLLAQIMSSAAVMICMLVDSIMIGQFLGVDAMAAYGLASPLLFVYTAFGSLVSTGIQVVCSKSITRGDKETTNICYTTAIMLALIVSLASLVVVIVFIDKICVMLGAEEGTEIFQLTKFYLRGFMFGAPAFLLSQILVPFMILSNNRTRLVIAVSLLTVADIVMDIVNVFLMKKGVYGEGFNSVKDGIFGMGFASALSYYVALVVAGIYLLSKKCIYKFVIRKFRLRHCFGLIKSGIPTAVNQLSLSMTTYLINLILLSSGRNEGVAVYSILATIGSICYSIGSGIGTVALELGGVFYVQEDRHSLYELVRVFVKYAVIIDLIVTVIVIGFAGFIMGLFISGTDDPLVLKLGTYALRVYILCLVSSSLNSSFKNYYLGIEKVKLSELVSVLQNFAYVVLAALILNALGGVKAIWFAFVIGETLTVFTIAVIAWIKKKKVVINSEAFSMLDPDFGVDDKDMVSFPISSFEQVREACDEAVDFCRGHGGDEQVCSRLALCIEEMGTNIIKHGFSDGKEHDMQLRVIDKKGSWMIGFMDDCKGFDPIKYRKKHKFDNSYSRLGLKLVFDAATDVKYVNALGLNNLTIML